MHSHEQPSLRRNEAAANRLPKNLTAFLEDDMLPVFSVDDHGQIIYRNQAFDTLFGFNRRVGQACGRASLAGPLRKEYERRKSDRDPEEFRVPSETGEPSAFYEIQWREMEAKAGEKRFLVGFLKNVTVDREAETQAARAQRDSQAVIDAVPGVVFQYVVESDLSGRFTYLSDSAKRYLGFSPQELIADPNLLKPHPDDREELFAKQQAAFTSGEDFLHTCRFILPKKGVRWLRGFSRGERVGEQVVYNGMFQDVSDEVEATQKLRVEHSKVEALLEVSGEAILLVDEQLKVRRANQKAKELFARPELQLKGASLPDLIAEPEAEKRAASLVKSGGIVRLLGHEATRVVADVRASSVREHGETLSVLSLRDLTDRLAFEEREQELIRRFDQATDAANIGVWELNTGTLKAEWSDRACEIFGVDPEQFRGTAEEWRKVPHPEDARKVDAVIADAVKTQAPFETEFRILQPSGEERIVRVAGCAEEAQGDPETLILAGVCTDVTEARRLEQREKDLLRRFGQATNAANIGIWEYLPSSDELYWSDQIFEMFGTSRESFAGTSTDFERAVHAEDLAKVKEAMEGGLASREDFEAEFRVVRPDGSVRHVKSLASIDDTDAKKPRVVGVTLDVTEQRRLERREKELIQRFESATNAAGIGVWEWDVDTGSLSWSSQMYAIYGIPVESAAGTYKDWQKALHPEDAGRAQRELTEAVEEGKPFETEFRIIRPDGAVRVVKAIAIRNGEGGYGSKITGVNFDITERVESLARESELIRRFESATNAAKMGVWEYDIFTEELSWSEQMFDLFDVDQEDFSGQFSDWSNAVHPEDAAVTRAHLQECIEQKKPFQAIFRVIRKDGEIRYVTAVADIEKQGKDARRITGINFDVTDERLQTERLHLQERCLEVAANGIVITDKKGHIIWANAAFSTLTGYSESEVLGKNPRFLRSGLHDRKFYRELWKTIRTGHTWHGELINRRKNGSLYTEDMTISPVRDATGKVSHFIAIKQDISKRKQAEKRVRQQGEEIQLHLEMAEQRRSELEDLNRRLRYIAERDSLTGLMSRRMFQEVLEQDIKSLAPDHSRRLALLFVDLDNFKLINDTMGHGAGDAILKIAGKRIAAVAEDLGAEAARLGGDEFTLLLKHNPNDEAIRHLAERVLHALQQPFALWDRELIVTGSVGIAYESDPQASAQDMLAQADTAMYRAKSAGKSQSVSFEPWMNEEAKYRLEVENELRHALSRDELFIQYQPLVDLETRLPLGVEALVRWQHPVRGFVSPGDFIPLAEEVGLIGQIGEWVLRETCDFWRRSVNNGLFAEDFVVSVNVSVKQLVDPGFIDTVQEVIQTSGIRPASLKLEVTETSMMHSVDAVQDALFALRELGAQIAMDDFGTGYSSMGSLVKLPVDTVKIDKSFVDEIGNDLRATAIMRALVTLCSTLNLEVIGEGIETEDQLVQLNALGCRIGQGYFLGKPMLEERLLDYLQQNAA